jgi:hypothetical protein
MGDETQVHSTIPPLRELRKSKLLTKIITPRNAALCIGLWDADRVSHQILTWVATTHD